MFYVFGVGLNLFLLLLLISKKNKSFADKILTTWLLIIGCHLSLYVLSFQPITINKIHQMGLSIPFPFLHGPFLYLYTAAVTNQLPPKKFLWLHLLPAVLVVSMALPFFISSAGYKMEVFNNNGKGYLTFLNVAGLFMKLSGIIYVAWSFILLRKHKKNIGNLFSYEEKINLNWLRYLIYALLVVWVIVIFIQKDSFIFGAVVICIFFLGFFGIKQMSIFVQQENSLAGSFTSNKPIRTEEQPVLSYKEDIIPATENQDEPDANCRRELEKSSIKEAESVKQKYSNSGLSEKMAIEIHERLDQLMTHEKTYTEPELSLAMLAGKLNVHPNYLSQVINEKEGKSFFDYINNLRVEEFKRLISLPGSNRFTFLSLAYDCGFNSKSSFNKNFKKVTGVSPSEYIAGLSKMPGL